MVIDCCGKRLAVIVGKHGAAKIELMFIALAGGAAGTFLGAGERGQDQGSKNRSNRDDNTQFNQGKAIPLNASVAPALEVRLHTCRKGLLKLVWDLGRQSAMKKC